MKLTTSFVLMIWLSGEILSECNGCSNEVDSLRNEVITTNNPRAFSNQPQKQKDDTLSEHTIEKRAAVCLAEVVGFDETRINEASNFTEDLEGGDAMFSEDIFMDFILENEVLKIATGEPFTLKSGRKSRWYVNWRTAASNAKLLNLLARMVVDFAIEKELQPHCFYGVKEGATKLGVITQMRWALAHAGVGTDDERVLNVPMGRGKAKEHGDPKDANFIGAPAGKVVILEDVTTTGGSLFAETRFIQEKLDDAEVIAAIGLTDRLQSDVPKMMMDEFGIPYYAMSQADRLLMRAFEKYECDEALRNEMIDDYNEFAIRKIEYTKNGE